MFTSDQYELLDVGDGRKLERFGQYTLDRPAPAAVGTARQQPQLWKRADAFFDRHTASQGQWSPRGGNTEPWLIHHGPVAFELKRTESGAVGVFPEQAENWDWIEHQVSRARRPLKVLNLFGYTGGSTLAAAAAGAEVVHVDAARSVVNWARRNAEHSGLQDAPIRWIVEDARKFARREVRRGAQYDAVILDPPTYGHGPKAQPWKLTHHLNDLLESVRDLTQQQRVFILLTCHAPGVGPPELEAMLADNVFGHCQAGARAQQLVLGDPDGQRLPSGVVAKWPGSK